MKWIWRNAAFVFLFAAGLCVHALVHDARNQCIMYFIIAVTFFAGIYEGNKNPFPKPMTTCRFCGRSIMLHYATRSENVWKDSTGSRICVLSPDGSKKLPHVPKGLDDATKSGEG